MALRTSASSDSLLENPVGLLQKLVRFDTSNPPGREKECIAYIKGLLEPAGFDTQILGRSINRPNLITRIEGRGIAPPLFLHGHVDVVPANEREWDQHPFEAKIVDDYLWGRGTLDMKGGIVMMLNALSRLKSQGIAPPGDVVLALVSDEETGGEFGTKYIVQNHPHLFQGIRYAVGEFGGFSFPIGTQRFYPVMVAEKQLCVLRATVRRPGGPGSLRNRTSATERLGQMLGRLHNIPLPVHLTPVTRDMFKRIGASMPWPASTLFGGLGRQNGAALALRMLGERGLLFGQLLRNTANPTMLKGGEQINVVPTEVTLALDGRLLPGQSPQDLIRELKRVIGGDIDLEVIHYDPGPAEPDMGLFDTLSSVLRESDPKGVPVPMLLPGATDGRFLARLGIQSYGFLPMSLPKDFAFTQTVHGINERIPLDALAFGVEAMYQLLLRFGEGQIGPGPLLDSGWWDPQKAVSQA